MRVFFFLLFSRALLATVNEPLRWELISGYRNDRIHWHIQDPGNGGTLTYSEVYRDVQYWLNGLVLKVIHRDLSFFIQGAYGAFGKGNMTAHFSDLTQNPHLHMQTDGWAADFSGYFGYAVNLTADRTYKVILTPLIGYAGYFEQLTRDALPGSFRLVWNGFFFGGQFLFETGGPVILTAGYAYNLMHNRVHAHLQNGSLKTNSGGNGGQSGWAQIDWKLPSYWGSCLETPWETFHWRLGLGGEIHYFTTRVVDASLSQEGRGDFSQKFKLRWTPVSGWMQLSRSF